MGKSLRIAVAFNELFFSTWFMPVERFETDSELKKTSIRGGPDLTASGCFVIARISPVI
jgi:hypothetical protein